MAACNFGRVGKAVIANSGLLPCTYSHTTLCGYESTTDNRLLWSYTPWKLFITAKGPYPYTVPGCVDIKETLAGLYRAGIYVSDWRAIKAANANLPSATAHPPQKLTFAQGIAPEENNDVARGEFLPVKGNRLRQRVNGKK